MSSISEFLKDKTVFITGATGFLGQPLVEKMLWSSPGVRRIYVLIRPKRQSGGKIVAAAERLQRELFESSAFDRIRSFYQDRADDFLSEKLAAVAGDISEENLGLDPFQLAQLRREVDIVINSAAVVSFDAPLNEALELNVLGAERVAKFTAACERAILIHVSTAYVCGAATGDVMETLYHVAGPGEPDFPPRKIKNPQLEIHKIREISESVISDANSIERKRDFKRALVKRLRRRRNRMRGKRRALLESITGKWVAAKLSKEGMRWARRRGWNDTYTYTKAIGERVVIDSRGSAPTAIIRPSVIESSLSEPSPGWLDGLRMADPLIVAIGKGRLRSLPLDPKVNLDLVPVDMVVNALLAAIPETATSRKIKVYQVATGAVNPINLGTLHELIVEYFQKNPMLNKEGEPIRIRRLRFPNPAAFRLQHRLRAVPLGTAERTLERWALFDATQKVRRRIAATRVAYEKLYYYGEIYEPYLNLNCRFQVDETLRLSAKLSEQEKREFNFDVSRLNWRHYIQNVHIPGVKKYILKLEGTGTLEVAEEEAMRREAFTIHELLDRAAARFPERTALQVKRGKEWARFTYAEVRSQARDVGKKLLSVGLKKGDRVVLFSENQPEWGICYLGAASAGIVVVPLDAQSWHREVWSVADWTQAKALLVSENCLDKFPEAGLLENEALEAPRLVLNVNRLCNPFDRPDLPRSTRPAGDHHATEGDWPSVEPDDVASIIFTTGTAADPRGAVHTHRNFLNNLYGVNHYLAVTPDDQFLSVLPLYHALEFSCGFLMVIYGGATVSYAHSLKPKNLLETMRETGTTCMLGVPTLYALIRDDLERRILKSSKSTFKSNWAETSKNFSRSVEKRFGKNIGRRVFARIHEEFGGRIRVFVSGGSALGEELYRDFLAFGVPIYEGYGLTETAPVLTVNPLHRSREGSAGKPIPGVELRLYHPDHNGIGEIIVRTPSLMKEYFRNEAATSQVMKDGWFHTGDLGWVDADGYVYISGRIKDVIVTGAGKNVYPTDLEAIYRTLPGVRDICVLGIKSGLTEDVHAVIVPQADALEEATDDGVKKVVQKQIQTLARELPSYHRLQAIHMWSDPLPRDACGKLQRSQIRAELARQINGRDGRPETGGSLPRRVREASQEDAIYEELSRLSGEPIEEINEESNLYSDLGLDSLMAMELLLFLEHRLQTAVDDSRIGCIQSVGDLLQELRRTGASASNEQQQPDAPRSTLPLISRPLSDRLLLGASFLFLSLVYRFYFGFQVRNGAALEKSPKGFIVAANHSSHADTGAMIAAFCRALGFRAARMLHVAGARDYFFNTSLKSRIFSNCLNVVPLEREEVSLAGLRTVKRILEQGEPVLIFPEGTRSRTGSLQKFKPGIGLLALEFNVPILPACIRGTFQALPPGARFPRPRRISVEFGEWVSPERYAGSEQTGNRDGAYRRIARDVRESVQKMLERGQ
ncbi:MAG TPA: AMP-binding protein [Acidobacteriota bacterium]|nr:AMP-binding protein [Acidobacteriota bacterium]